MTVFRIPLALAFAGAVCAAGEPSVAQDYAPAAAPPPPTSALIDEEVVAGIRDWLKNAVVPMSIEAQNRRYGDISEAEIKKLDAQWVAEREQDDQPLVATTLSSPLSIYVTQVQAGSLGLYAEIIVMDDKGLNVGQSGVTSDFWQGDEAKFQKTFPVGTDAVFVDEAEKHDGTNTWRTQVNMTVTNDSGTAIGAVTVEVNLTELARRRGAVM